MEDEESLRRELIGEDSCQYTPAGSPSRERSDTHCADDSLFEALNSPKTLQNTSV